MMWRVYVMAAVALALMTVIASDREWWLASDIATWAALAALVLAVADMTKAERRKDDGKEV